MICIWTSYQQEDAYGVFGQLLDKNGEKIGSEFQINTHEPNAQESAVVTVLNNDTFVVAWHCQNDSNTFIEDIRAQMFDSTGNKIGSEFTVNQYSEISAQNFPNITSTSDGGFVVAWCSVHQDGSSGGVYIRRYDEQGNPTSDEMQINQEWKNNQNDPSVVELDNGNLVVTWQCDTLDGDGRGIVSTIVNPDNTMIDEFVVNTQTTGSKDIHTTTVLKMELRNSVV